MSFGINPVDLHDHHPGAISIIQLGNGYQILKTPVDFSAFSRFFWPGPKHRTPQKEILQRPSGIAISKKKSMTSPSLGTLSCQLRFIGRGLRYTPHRAGFRWSVDLYLQIFQTAHGRTFKEKPGKTMVKHRECCHCGQPTMPARQKICCYLSW